MVQMLVVCGLFSGDKEAAECIEETTLLVSDTPSYMAPPVPVMTNLLLGTTPPNS